MHRLDAVGGLMPKELDRRFEAVVFDWDGTAVPNRRADATDLKALAEALSACGVELVAVSGTGLDNVDGQLHARPDGQALPPYYRPRPNTRSRPGSPRSVAGTAITLRSASRCGQECPRDRVLALADELGADALILAWSQRLMPERAALVKSVLEHSRIPVILVPVAHSDDRRAVPG